MSAILGMGWPAVLAVGGAVVVGGLLLGCRSTPKGPAPDGADDLRTSALACEPLAAGAQSAIREPGAHVAQDRAELEALWAAHGKLQLPPPTPPKVDFDAQFVVGVFLGGRATGGFGVVIDSVHVAPDGTIVVRATEESPDPGAVLTQATTAPFEFVAVERVPALGSDAPVHLEWVEAGS